MFNRFLQTSILLLPLSLAAYANAELPNGSRNLDRDSLTELVVELTDDQGNPVADAAVVVYAMRMVEDQGHGYWNREKLGSPVAVISDANGQAVVKYPARVSARPKSLTTRLVTFSVKHYDFVAKTVHFDIGPEKAEVTLKRGCDIQLSAVDSSRQPVDDFAVLIAGRYSPEDWVDDGNGGRRTGAASDGNWQTLLVKPQDNGVTLFSSVLPLRVRPEQAVRIRNVRLKPGTRLTGNLSDNVPRPVQNGYVITVTAPKPANDSYSEEAPSITWHQWEPINPDGTFVLQSIPRSGKIQVIAVCDGWLSKTIPKENFFVKGHLFDIDDDEVDVTVEMEETGTLEVVINTPGGEPLDGGTISSWPNQQYFKGGSTWLGARYSTMTSVLRQITPIDRRKPIDYRPDMNLPFSKQPVRNGIATLRGLPVGRKNSIVLQHAKWILSAGDDKDDENVANAAEAGTVSFLIESPDTKRITVQLQSTDPVAADASPRDSLDANTDADTDADKNGEAGAADSTED
ncbi:MAG: hypothetical protein HKN47_26260 [Pirellulaceae bacterium]|nr:hypothetical protein [Pirellulaceae bacterium]